MTTDPIISIDEFQSGLAAWLDSCEAQIADRPHLDDWAARSDYDKRWQRALYDAGYAGLTWPRQYGGQGLGADHQMVLIEECAKRGAPNTGIYLLTPALAHVSPVLIAEGTDQQRADHLGPILRGERIWCQGFTEYGAGSDMAAVEMRADRDGDHYVLNGVKAWISYAQAADWCETLVRTGEAGSRHKGLSWLMVDMTSPGITVKPIKTLHDQHDACEILFENVRIPVGNRVGEENDGWRLMLLTFGFERTLSAVPEILFTERLLGHALDRARKTGRVGPVEEAEFGHLVAQTYALKNFARLNVASLATPEGPGVNGSALKLRFSEQRERMSNLVYRTFGREFLEGNLVNSSNEFSQLEELMHTYVIPIFAGTSQIHRNTIAERGLCLPRGN